MSNRSKESDMYQLARMAWEGTLRCNDRDCRYGWCARCAATRRFITSLGFKTDVFGDLIAQRSGNPVRTVG